MLQGQRKKIFEVVVLDFYTGKELRKFSFKQNDSSLIVPEEEKELIDIDDLPKHPSACQLVKGNVLLTESVYGGGRHRTALWVKDSDDVSASNLGFYKLMLRDFEPVMTADALGNPTMNDMVYRVVKEKKEKILKIYKVSKR